MLSAGFVLVGALSGIILGLFVFALLCIVAAVLRRWRFNPWRLLAGGLAGGWFLKEGSTIQDV